MKYIYILVFLFLSVDLFSQIPTEFSFSTYKFFRNISWAAGQQMGFMVKRMIGLQHLMSGSCCGASSLIIFNNIAYINLTIYGDDAQQ